MALPTSKLAPDIDLSRARILIHAEAKAGKTSLMGGWFPDTTLALDFDDAWRLLPGSHYRETPSTFSEVDRLVTELLNPGADHPFKTVLFDTLTRAWRMADIDAGRRYGKNAAGVVDYGKGTSDRDGTLMNPIARLFASRLGVILLAHSERVFANDDDKVGRWEPKIDKKIYADIVGGVDHVFYLRVKPDGARELVTHGGPDVYARSRFNALPATLPIPTLTPGQEGKEGARALHDALREAGLAQVASPVPASTVQAPA